jgi:hypothetical protein
LGKIPRIYKSKNIFDDSDGDGEYEPTSSDSESSSSEESEEELPSQNPGTSRAPKRDIIVCPGP